MYTNSHTNRHKQRGLGGKGRKGRKERGEHASETRATNKGRDDQHIQRLPGLAVPRQAVQKLPRHEQIAAEKVDGQRPEWMLIVIHYEACGPLTAGAVSRRIQWVDRAKQAANGANPNWAGAHNGQLWAAIATADFKGCGVI